MAAKLNEMSTIIIEWIREMDAEPGETFRGAAEAAGVTDDPAKMGSAMKAAFCGINLPFLAAAPSFLRDAFAHCLEQIDWEQVARTRFEETAEAD